MMFEGLTPVAKAQGVCLESAFNHRERDSIPIRALAGLAGGRPAASAAVGSLPLEQQGKG